MYHRHIFHPAMALVGALTLAAHPIEAIPFDEHRQDWGRCRDGKKPKKRLSRAERRDVRKAERDRKAAGRRQLRRAA